MQRLNDMSTSELITIARNYSTSIKEIGIYSELVKELTTRLAASTAAANEGSRHAARADALVAENAYLLPKAASELSNAWVLHKYWVGIQVALMHVREGRLHDGMVWLQNTISGPGIEAPELKEFAEIEAWAAEQQKDSIGHVRALEIIKAETPDTAAALAAIRNEERAEGAEPLVKALTVIANSEEIDGDTVVCDFSTLVSVAAGALRDHYAQQLRKESCKCSS